MKKAISVLYFLIGILSIAIAQSSQKESLFRELAMASPDSSRVLIISEICKYYVNRNTDSAMIYGNQALVLAEQISFPKGEAQILRTLGISTWLQGNIPESLKLIFKGLRIAEENHLLYETAWCLQGIGNIYSLGLNDYKKAMDYYYKALFLIDTPNQDAKIANLKCAISSTVGINYIQINQYDSAYIYLQKAINDSTATEAQHAVQYMFMGKLQFHLGNKQLAMELLQKSIQLHMKNNMDRGICEACNIYAGLFKEMNQPDSAIYYAKKGLSIAQSISYKQEMLKASILLAELYESKDIAEAYKNIMIAQEINEELYGAKKVQSLQILISEEQERQQKIEDENLAYQNRLRMNAFLGVTFTLVIIAIFLFILSRRKQKAKQKIESAFNQLKAAQSQLIQSEKMASLGELTAGIAHEIQNPLNFVNNFSEVNNELIDELNDELDKGDIEEAKAISKDIKENGQKINHHGKRADAIVKGMLQHSRTSTGQKELTDINALADEYLRLAYHGLRAKDKSFNADFKTDFDESLPKINVIPQDIGRVLLNLINNAFYAVQAPPPPGGGIKNSQNDYKPTVIVRTSSFIPPAGGPRGACISVIDNGPGIPDKILDKIFQPFFTTKPTGSGTGLGLSLSYDIVKAHGGEIKVESKENEGTEFIIHLPTS